ncbi:MAG: GNAT family N-acetyltransferase [Bdellovibrionota bacterium]
MKPVSNEASTAIENPFTDSANAKNYDLARPRYHDMPFGQLKEYLNATIDSALDVACGTGHSTVALSKICQSVSGCDSSAAMLAEAKSHSHLSFVLASAEQLSFENQCFSLVNISMGIHWVNQDIFLSEANRVLKPHGYLSVDNYGFSGRMNFQNGFDDFNKDFYKHHFPAPARGPNYPENSRLEKSGFRFVHEFNYSHVVKMTLEDFVSFLFSQSNIILAQTKIGDNLRSMIRTAYLPYFGDVPRELIFSGALKLYQKHTPFEFRIRPSIPDDNTGIRKVQVETWKNTYRGMIPDYVLDQMTVENPPRRTKSPNTALTESRRSFVAIDAQNEIIGFAVGGVPRSSEGNYESELWAIYVLKEHQGKRIGKSLFKALTQELARSYKNMILWVLEANHSSHQFYESVGGKRLSLRKPFNWEDVPVAMEIAYAWDAISPVGDDASERRNT